MMALGIIATYVIAAVIGAGLLARWLADHWGTCSIGKYAGYRSLCDEFHSKGCWAPTGDLTIRVIAVAIVAAFIWPLTLVPVAVYCLASRRPSPILTQRRIAELEKELGVRRDRA